MVRTLAPAVPPAPDTPAQDFSVQIANLLAKPPSVEGIDLLLPDPPIEAGHGQRTLLAPDFRWQAAGGGVRARVPLQLCEYLAYKTALAYEPASRIEAYLTRCCDGISRIAVFDSARSGASEASKNADAQAYGFVFERRAFVIFRGTAGNKDWAINRIDAMTDDLGTSTDRRHQSLRQQFGALLDQLGNPSPGRHVGFSIAWAALKSDVEDWLSDALENNAIDQIIYSGHSLGGAMAQVAAFDHARIEAGFERDRGISPQRVGAVVTFGAPAVGGPDFATAYQKLLGDRTILLESSGDLVPRIMSRWYYRMLYPLRQRVKAGVQAHLMTREGFGKVATPWTFASEPPLSDQDIDNAISTIRLAAERALKDVAAAQKKREADAAKKAERETASTAAETKPKDAATPARKPDSTAAPATSELTPSWFYWAVVGVVVVAAGGIAWYFVRRKLFSHDIEQRYALYLSTLTYQQLRAKHGGNLERANQELGDHLRFVRGDGREGLRVAAEFPDNEGANAAIFGSVQALPLPIKIRNDPAFIAFLQHKETFV